MAKKKTFIFLSSLIIVFLFPFVIKAQSNIEISPHVIDETVKPRDIYKYEIEIKNNSNNKASLYAFVNDITPSEGRQEFSTSELDQSVSLARWIKIRRGVIEIEPLGSVTVPLEIDISVLAKPGKRYAAITFAESSNRYDAGDSVDKLNLPRLMINVDVSDLSVEAAKLMKFEAGRNLYVGFPVKFIAEIDNFGTRSVLPHGSLLVYNKRGEELGEVKIGSDKFRVEAGEKKEFEIGWDGSGKSFGKHKVMLRLEYGKNEKRDLQDTVYFWYFPKYFVISFLFVLFLSVFILTYIIFKKTHQHHDGGLIKEDKDRILDLR